MSSRLAWDVMSPSLKNRDRKNTVPSKPPFPALVFVAITKYPSWVTESKRVYLPHHANRGRFTTADRVSPRAPGLSHTWQRIKKEATGWDSDLHQAPHPRSSNTSTLPYWGPSIQCINLWRAHCLHPTPPLYKELLYSLTQKNFPANKPWITRLFNQ